MSKTEYPPTPELDRLNAVKDKSQAIGEFVDIFLRSKGIELCKVEKGGQEYWPTHEPIEILLAEHFKIDLKKAEKERRAILDYINKTP